MRPESGGPAGTVLPDGAPMKSSAIGFVAGFLSPLLFILYAFYFGPYSRLPDGRWRHPELFPGLVDPCGERP